MTDLNLTKPYTCRNGWKAFAEKKGDALMGWYDTTSGLAPFVWLLNGHAALGVEAPLDLINVEPKREPIVRWVVFTSGGTLLASFPSEGAAKGYATGNPYCRIIKLVEVPDDQL